MESGPSECHVDERVRCYDQDEDLGCSCYVVIYEPSPFRLIHLAVDLAIGLWEEETFKEIETDEEVIDEDDANNERAERGKTRDRLQRYMRNVRVAVMVKTVAEVPRGY